MDTSAKEVFCQLLDRLQTSRQAQADGFLDIPLEKNASLAMEKIPGTVDLLWGKGQRYKLTYRCVSGQSMVIRDPEMVFLVVDYRSDPDEYSLIGIYACSYVSDHVVSNQSSLTFDNDQLTSYVPHLHALHTAFATLWMNDLLTKGCLGDSSDTPGSVGSSDKP